MAVLAIALRAKLLRSDFTTEITKGHSIRCALCLTHSESTQKSRRMETCPVLAPPKSEPMVLVINP